MADLVIVTVPFAAQKAKLAAIASHVAGKSVVDTTVPLVPSNVMRVQLLSEGSAAQRATELLGNGPKLISGFHNVATHKLITDEEIACDILVLGADREAREEVIKLADIMGPRGIHAGALCNSAAAEAMTSILIFFNRTYRMDGAGISDYRRTH